MTTYGMREPGGAGEWMMNAVTRNPEGLLLVAAGAALLMRTGRGRRPEAFAGSQGSQHYARSHTNETETVREHVGEAARRAGEYVSEAAETARGAARRAGEYVSDATDKVGNTARSYATSAADYADEASRAAMERSRRMAEQARETADYVVREQPWAVTLAGLIAGAAVAAAFPPSRFERRTLGEVGEHLRSAAGAAGERVKQAGMKAGERLGEMAEEHGLTAEGLTEAAREVGETFSSTLQGEEAEGSSQPRPGAGKAKNRPSQTSSSIRSGQSGSATTGGTQNSTGPSGSSSRGMLSGDRR